MKRIGAESGDPDLLVSAYSGAGNETLVAVNRSTIARKLEVKGATRNWAEMERTGLEDENTVSAVPAGIVIQPGEIVVLSTIKAE
jgi:hypothetical protein